MTTQIAPLPQTRAWHFDRTVTKDKDTGLTIVGTISKNDELVAKVNAQSIKKDGTRSTDITYTNSAGEEKTAHRERTITREGDVLNYAASGTTASGRTYNRTGTINLSV